MSKVAWLAGSLAMGVAGGVLGSLLVPSPPPAAAPADPVPASHGPSRADFDRLERRLDELSSTASGPAKGSGPADAPALLVPESAPRSAAGSDTSGRPSHPASPDRLDALERRLAALESRGSVGTAIPADLSKLPVAQLEALVRNLTAERRSADVIPVAEELLRRGELTSDQRVDAEMNVGYGLRSQGKNAEAEARFRETLARVGDDSEKAPWLEFQIGWERSYQKDLQGGIAAMEKAANHARVQPIVRAHALYNAASFARQAGETARARVFLERLLTQHADAIPPAQASMKAQAEAWLKELTGS